MAMEEKSRGLKDMKETLDNPVTTISKMRDQSWMVGYQLRIWLKGLCRWSRKTCLVMLKNQAQKWMPVAEAMRVHIQNQSPSHDNKKKRKHVFKFFRPQCSTQRVQIIGSVWNNSWFCKACLLWGSQLGATRLAFYGFSSFEARKRDEQAISGEIKTKALQECWFPEKKKHLSQETRNRKQTRNIESLKCLLKGTLWFSFCASRGEERTRKSLLSTSECSPCLANTSTSGFPEKMTRRSGAPAFSHTSSEF